MDTFYQYFDRARQWWDDLSFSQFQRRALFAISLPVIAVSVFIVTRGDSEEIIAPLIVPIEVTAPTLTIDVAGEVINPGVYSLPDGSRVIDAIAAAGGANPKAALSDLNLARMIKDGEQIFVDLIYKNGSSKKSTPVHHGPININRASTSEFDSLNGIGPVIAARIVAYRSAHGPFATIEDIQNVSGIGAAKFAQFKDRIQV
ncbi:unannotated protein [freshwater metagenome]|uniref:Unannotated protein n=1 Tax=freshwater metagenome TaxID=449393 RepID=A0A6J7XW45_9ZZZZ|nr:hypothetical protein [Actinomycetota bacterium]